MLKIGLAGSRRKWVCFFSDEFGQFLRLLHNVLMYFLARELAIPRLHLLAVVAPELGQFGRCCDQGTSAP
jgi:hypothetical protein